MKRNLDLLTTPGFLIALSLLLANDFLLKPAFHNALTGKLSDFAGLFAFAIFWTALFPKHKRIIHLIIAFGFLFWKSNWSQPLIDGWNDLPLFGVARTVDYSDMLALLVLPFAYLYCEKNPSSVWSFGFAPHMLTLVAVFAFTATSFADERSFSPRKIYRFNMSKAELLDRLNRLPRVRLHRSESVGPDSYSLTLDFKFCTGDTIHPYVEIRSQEPNVTEMSGLSIRYFCPTTSDEWDRQVLQIFEREVTSRFNPEILETEPLPSPSPTITTMPMLNSSPERR
jgi:hypothetical protein